LSSLRDHVGVTQGAKNIQSGKLVEEREASRQGKCIEGRCWAELAVGVKRECVDFR